MKEEIKQAKLREEFMRKFPYTLDVGELEEVADFWLDKLSQAKLETLEAIIKEVEAELTSKKGEGSSKWDDEIKQAMNHMLAFHPEYAVSQRELQSFTVRFVPLVRHRLLSTLQAQKELIENNK